MTQIKTLDPSPSADISVSVVGLGHVGLVTALGLAEMGWRVLGTDQDSRKLESIKAGEAPFYEPGLQELLDKHLDSGLFNPLADLDDSISRASVVFLCVGTPQRSNGEADLSQLESVARSVAQRRNDYLLVVEKSTAPVTSAQWIGRTVERYGHSKDRIDIACNPEFLREGTAVHDFLNPDRIVLGVETDRAKDILLQIYAPLDCPKLVTDLNTAELIKHASNAFLSTKISFINMVANLCEATGADVTKVSEGLGLDPRIGRSFLNAGIGFGGYCFPKDIRAFAHIGEVHGVNMSLLRAVEDINLDRVERFIARLRSHLWMLNGKTVAVLGLAFKPGTDDVRESPAVAVARRLREDGANLRLYDPQAGIHARSLLPAEPGRVEYFDDPYKAVQQADAALVLTEWPEFAELDLGRVKKLMRVPILGDGRNVYDPSSVRKLGFEYFSVGRP